MSKALSWTKGCFSRFFFVALNKMSFIGWSGIIFNNSPRVKKQIRFDRSLVYFCICNLRISITILSTRCDCHRSHPTTQECKTDTLLSTRCDCHRSRPTTQECKTDTLLSTRCDCHRSHPTTQECKTDTLLSTRCDCHRSHPHNTGV